MLKMFLKKINKAKNQKGFTLVELIVVIAILGILAAVTIGRFGGLTDNAKQKADLATAATLASAAQVYLANTDKVIEADTVIAFTDISQYVETPKKPRYNASGTFVITAKANNNVEVSDGKNSLYPTEPATWSK